MLLEPVASSRRRRRPILSGGLVLVVLVLLAGGVTVARAYGVGRSSCTATATSIGSDVAASSEAAFDQWRRDQPWTTPRWGWRSMTVGAGFVTYRAGGHEVEVVGAATGWQVSSVTRPC